MLKLPSKYRKMHSRKSTFSRAPIVSQNGCFCLISRENGFLNLKQLNALRKYAKFLLKKQTKFWINASAQITVTKKPNEARMGKGKANLKYWVFFQKKGSYLFEVKGLFTSLSLTMLSKRLSLKTAPIFKIY